MRCPKCNSKIEESISLYDERPISLVRSNVGNWFISGGRAIRCTDEFKKINPMVEYFKIHDCGGKNDNSKKNQELPFSGRR